MSSALSCSVDWTLSNPPTCSGVLSNIPSSLPFDPSQLDPVAVVSAMASGAAVVFPAYAVAWGVAQVIKMLSGGSHG
ncbi:hypothetical protein [Methylobacter sp. S3L5C]|uniref:hypothetical protein n=1 Tax=Methylobacter sp. S3L5C TaxID=2839024 RepID=UPI001FAB6DDD|nr:hypothetical protein [Methylobacter sp. S3L5C]UOA07509.1 hypothetical protein KKZ03_14705 [Methylobacter sp. S3L5C]UOA07519.1 hypothetical protein KKZ03_14755 [Methylobacter sp. S3L5C]